MENVSVFYLNSKGTFWPTQYFRTSLASVAGRLPWDTPVVCPPGRGGGRSRPLSTLYVDLGLGGAHYLI